MVDKFTLAHINRPTVSQLNQKYQLLAQQGHITARPTLYADTARREYTADRAERMGGYSLTRRPYVGKATTHVMAPHYARRYAYGGTRRRWRRGYSRIGGFYGRYNNYSVGHHGGELKFHDVDLDDATVSSSGDVTASINLIAQGTSESERNGRKCTLKSILWRYTVVLPEVDALATPAPADTIRIIMYLDRQCNGATAADTDVLESADYQSYRNLANSGRFSILHDKSMTLNYNGMASDGAGLVSQNEVTRQGHFYKKCDIPLEFNSTAGAITEIRSNNIGVILISRGTNISFLSKIRLRFSDASAPC